MDIVVYGKYKVEITGRASVLVNSKFDKFKEHNWYDEKIMTGGELMSLFAKNMADNQINDIDVINKETIHFGFFDNHSGEDKDLVYKFTPIIE